METVPRHRSVRLRAALVVLSGLAAVAFVGCGNDDGELNTAGDDSVPHRSDDAHPFTAKAPAGFEVVTAGRGGWTQSWGDDSTGNDAPFTVVTDDTSTVTISALGYAGMEGHVDQALGYSPDAETFKVDGHKAIFVPPSKDEPQAKLGVVLGDDELALLSGPSVDRPGLVAIANGVKLADDHGLAPAVTKLPAGWKVVGSVSADLLGAVEGYFGAGEEVGPGPASGYGVGWMKGEQRLSVTAIDGAAADLDALIPRMQWEERNIVEGHHVDVEGQPGVVLDICGCGNPDSKYIYRSVITHSRSGALVVVTAGVEAVPEKADLIAVAASVRPIDQKAWDAIELESRMKGANGPGLNPDVGEVEVLRGEEEGLEWLLQTARRVDQTGDNSVIDACLKLSDYTRTCALPRGGDQNGAAFFAAMDGEVKEGMSPFLIVTIPTETVTKSADVSIKVTTRKGSNTAQLAPVPGTESSVAILFVDDVGTPVCTTDPKPPESMKPITVELLDASGKPTACIGY